MYSNSCCICSFEPEIIKIRQSSHKIYSNNILNFQESTTILNACTKMSGNLLTALRTFYKFLSFTPLNKVEKLILLLLKKKYLKKILLLFVEPVFKYATLENLMTISNLLCAVTARTSRIWF